MQANPWGGTMETFEYLLDLAMAITDCDADADAVREAHAAMVAIDAERGRAADVWHTAHERARLASPSTQRSGV